MTNKEEISKPPTVFISYSWTNDEHIERVLDFAYQLMNDHVQVIIDEWDAPEGIDLNYFMEENVRSPETDFVLIVSDKEYAIKADNRDGGVGKETQIISKRVYDDVKQTKFIPIVWETSEDGKPYLPDYLSSRRYFDLSPKNYYKNYNRLLRRLHNVPENPKPKLGEFPQELLKTKPRYPKLKEINSTFETKVDKNPKAIDSITKDFTNNFYKSLEDFRIKLETNNPNEIATQVYANIESYTPLRDYYIEFFDKATKVFAYAPLDGSILIEFFEKMFNNFTTPKLGESYKIEDYMNFDFIIRELFLYSILIALDNYDYELVATLLNNPYYFKDIYQDSQDPQTFIELDRRGRILTDRYLTLHYQNKELNQITGMGHNLVSRIHPNYEVEALVNADILCCHISVINFDNSSDWFPFTYIYKESSSFPFYQKLTSETHCEKVKCIFDIEYKHELEEKINVSKNFFEARRYGFSNAMLNYVKPISSYVNVKNIATKR